MGFLDRFRRRTQPIEPPAPIPPETHRPCAVCGEQRLLASYLDTDALDISGTRPVRDVCERCRVVCVACHEPRHPVDLEASTTARRNYLERRAEVLAKYGHRRDIHPYRVECDSARRELAADPDGTKQWPQRCDLCCGWARCVHCGAKYKRPWCNHCDVLCKSHAWHDDAPCQVCGCTAHMLRRKRRPDHCDNCCYRLDLADRDELVAFLMRETTMTPLDVPADCVAIGADDAGEPVTLDRATRNRHLYLIGKSRTGKTTLMLNLMRADLAAGDGFTFIDPAGDAARDVLGYVPESRAGHVVYFDPTDEQCAALNLLALPYDRDKLAGEVVSAFRLFFDSWGPRMAMLLRNGLLTLLDDRAHEPHSIADLERLYIEPAYRDELAERATDPRLARFLTQDLPRYERSALDPVLNKLDAFLSTRLLARVFGSTTNALDFDDLLNNRRVLVCSLSKGKIGEEPAKFLGGLIVAALTVAALARADRPASERADHYLYVDEFQNFAVESFATIFAEAAKYRLNLCVAHQTRDQLTPEIRAALGNASTYVVFRVSADDAGHLARELAAAPRPPDFRPKYRAELDQRMRELARFYVEHAAEVPEYYDNHQPRNLRTKHTDDALPTVLAYARDPARFISDWPARDRTTAHRSRADDDALTALEYLRDGGPYIDRTPEPLWPTTHHIVNLDNLHAFARIERPENTTALTVPFPPPPSEEAREAVLTAQRARQGEERRARKPQDERSALNPHSTPHPNSTTFDDASASAVHSPPHAEPDTIARPRRRRVPQPPRAD